MSGFKFDARLPTNQYPDLMDMFAGKIVTVVKGRKYPKGNYKVKDIAYWEVYHGTYKLEEIVYFVCDNGERINSNNCVWDE